MNYLAHDFRALSDQTSRGRDTIGFGVILHSYFFVQQISATDLVGALTSTLSYKYLCHHYPNDDS